MRLGAAALLLLVAGCVHRTGDLTVLSSHTLSTPIEKNSFRVKGTTCEHTIWLLVLPIWTWGEHNFKEALDEALFDTPPDKFDSLVDVVTFKRSWWALFYSQNCVVIEGTPAHIGPRLSFDPVHLSTQSVPATPSSPDAGTGESRGQQ